MRSNCCQRLAASASMPVALGHGTSTSLRLRGECLALGLSSNCLWSCSASGRTQVLSSPGPLDTNTTESVESVNRNVKRNGPCFGKEMRMARLELARPKPHAPQTCVSTNSTTSAWPIEPNGPHRKRIIPAGVPVNALQALPSEHGSTLTHGH